jgi:ATP-dependent Clp protease ATP-binding subunit ClpA
MPGEFEERMKGVLKELMEASNHSILFIDDIHTVTGPNAQQVVLVVLGYAMKSYE